MLQVPSVLRLSAFVRLQSVRTQKLSQKSLPKKMPYRKIPKWFPLVVHQPRLLGNQIQSKFLT